MPSTHSPIILNSSSSPPALRLPTATPPSRRQASTIHAISSSPKLPSPSQLVRPKLPPSIRSGSRADAIPKGATTGFASASAVWDVRKVEEDAEAERVIEARRQEQEQRVRERAAEAGKEDALKKRGGGKLAKPRKKRADLGNDVAREGGEVTSKAGQNSRAENLALEEREEASIRPRSKRAGTARIPSKTPSVGLDEFAFRETDEAVVLPAKASTPVRSAKRPRKKAADGDTADVKASEDARPIKRRVAKAPASATTELAKNPSRTPSVSLDSFAFREIERTAAPSQAVPPPAEDPQDATREALAVSEPAGQTEQPRASSTTSSISMDGFALRKTDETVELQAVSVEAPKKPRKKVVKKDVPGPVEPAKKPGRRKVQSEEFILNSDEIEAPPLLAEGQTLDLEALPEQPREKIKKSRQRKADANAPTDYIEGAAPAKKQRAKRSSKAVGPEASAYFTRPPAPTDQDRQVDLNAAIASVAAPEKADATARDGAGTAAAFRRRSWTPVKDTSAPVVLDAMDDEPPADEAAPTPPRADMTALLGGFSYADVEQRPIITRTVSGEAATKRRRLEPVQTDHAKAAAKKAEAAAPIIKVKKAKKPPKKPQTITALATAAYMPAVPSDAADQATVSSFFAPTVSAVPEPAPPAQADTTAPPAKSKKPRKSRAKPRPESSSTTTSAPKPKRTKKVKTNPADPIPDLLMPDQSIENIAKQDFLFGTSSQLAAQESPTFVRDMQLAVHQSEISATQPTTQYGTQLGTQAVVSPQKKSYDRVPTAPHGTSLSVGQADRELWCVSARDHERGTLAAEEKVSGRMRDDEEEGLGRYEMSGATQIPMMEHYASEKPDEQRTEEAEIDKPNDGHEGLRSKAVVNYEQKTEEAETQDLGFVDVTDLPAAQSSPADNDDWMLLRSTQSDDLPPAAVIPIAQPIAGGNVVNASTQPARPAPVAVRTALQPLDSNVGIIARTSPGKSTFTVARAVSTSANDAAAVASPIKKKRGRPRKEEPRATSPPPPKKRGRPRKDPVPPTTEAAAPTKSKGTPPRPAVSQSDWHNVDEISDSDSPTTPSPPRRKATSTTPSPALPPLDLAPSPSRRPPQPAEPTTQSATSASKPTATSASTTLKPTDSQWPHMSSLLFPQITAEIKNSPRSASKQDAPTWHEKILLYDPIVLEDLTDWLNARGLRVRVERTVEVAKKGKGRGRKRKAGDGEGEVEVQGRVLVGEGQRVTEVGEEEVRAWMVQKWCEERGVCCLWREGLRGGVKARY